MGSEKSLQPFTDSFNMGSQKSDFDLDTTHRKKNDLAFTTDSFISDSDLEDNIDKISEFSFKISELQKYKVYKKRNEK